MHFTRLHSTYRAAWQCYSVEVDRWRSLQTETSANSVGVRDAEFAVHAAETRYRAARNALAEYILEHASRESVLV